MLHACNPSTWEVEAEGSEDESYPQLHKFKAVWAT